MQIFRVCPFIKQTDRQDANSEQNKNDKGLVQSPPVSCAVGW